MGSGPADPSATFESQTTRPACPPSSEQSVPCPVPHGAMRVACYPTQRNYIAPSIPRHGRCDAHRCLTRARAPQAVRRVDLQEGIRQQVGGDPRPGPRLARGIRMEERGRMDGRDHRHGLRPHRDVRRGQADRPAARAPRPRQHVGSRPPRRREVHGDPHLRGQAPRPKEVLRRDHVDKGGPQRQADHGRTQHREPPPHRPQEPRATARRPP